MRRADHRGSWAGHGRLSQADLLQLPPRALAPPRRRRSARESPLGRSSACSPGQIQVQVSEPLRPVPPRAGGRGRRRPVPRRLGRAGRRVVLGPRAAGRERHGAYRSTASFPWGHPCADARGRRLWKRGLGEQRRALELALPGNPLSPQPPPSSLPRRGTREPQPPPAAGARAPPRPVPKLGKLFNLFRGAPNGRGQGGGLGAAASGEVSRPFRNGGNGQARTVWQLSGRPSESESDNPAADIAFDSVSALRSRLPHSPCCERQGGPGDRERCGWVREEGVPGAYRAGRQERIPRSPTAPRPLTFDLCYPREEGPECPQPYARSRRAPDSTAPGGRPMGAGRAGSCSFRSRPRLLHRSCSGQVWSF